MRRTTLTLTLAVLAVFGVTACDSATSPELAAPETGLTVAPPDLSVHELSPSDQAAVDAFHAYRTTGAFIERGCMIVSPGFFNEAGQLLGFGGLFPDVPFGECENGFIRTNPDGTEDLHVNGKGLFFLLLFDPFAIYGSQGSSVKYTYIRHANGISILTVTGKLSDGSRVRGHFTSGDNRAGTLWVEGLGYVVGSPGGR